MSPKIPFLRIKHFTQVFPVCKERFFQNGNASSVVKMGGMDDFRKGAASGSQYKLRIT